MSEVSLADFVTAQREKKKREALAQQFLGSGARKANASGAGVANGRKTDQKPTLLSRMSGVQKQRSSSAKPAANIDGKWQHDLHRVNNPNGPPPRKLNRTASTPQFGRADPTEKKFAAVFNGARNGQNVKNANSGPGFSIKGVASRGPFTILASNFAPGTTGSDIEEVMAPHGMGSLLAVRVISPGPTVMAEIDFESKEGADNVIQVFNNQKADGKVLYVYHKNGPSTASLHTRPAMNERPVSRTAQRTSYDDMDMDVEVNGSFRNNQHDGRLSFNNSMNNNNNSGRRDPPRGPRRRF